MTLDNLVKKRSSSFVGLAIELPFEEDRTSSIAFNDYDEDEDDSGSGSAESRWSVSDTAPPPRRGTAAIKRKGAPARLERVIDAGSTSWDTADEDISTIQDPIVTRNSPRSPLEQDTINFHRRPSLVSPPPASTSTVPPSAPIPTNPISTASALSPRSYHRPTSARTATALQGRTRTLYSASPSPTSPNSSRSPAPSRAPVEAFGSYEMLQGQRAHAEKRRGSEVFKNGKYEGRSVDTNRSNRVSMAHRLPPMDLSFQVANSLRTDSSTSPEDRPQYLRRFSSNSSQGDGLKSANVTANDFALARSNSVLESLKSPPPPFESDASHDEYGDIGMEKEAEADGPYSEKSLYGSTWRKEFLTATGNTSDYTVSALPVYPSADGTMARSKSYRFKRFGVTLSIATGILAQVATWFYLVQRIESLIEVERRLPNVFVTGWAFLSVELLLAFLFTIHAIYDICTVRAPSTAAKLRLRGDSNLPTVDIFIFSAGHSDQVVFDCAVAAAAIDFPTNRFRVMIIDSIGSVALAKKILLHSQTQGTPHLTYHRRTLNGSKQDHVASKSNAMNFGVASAVGMGLRGAGEFVVSFDADVIPERNYLRAMLPCFIGSIDVALVQSPVGYFNLPQRVSQPVSTFMSTDSRSKYRSGFMLRRSALIEIGGFPLNSTIQDGLCSALLAGRGYRTVNHDEVLQFAAVQSLYRTQISDMMIDGLAPLRTAAQLRFYFGGARIAKMSFTSRISALALAFRPFLSVVVSLLTIAYPYMFNFGGIMVLVSSRSNLNLLLQYTLIMVFCDRLHEFVFSLSSGRPSPRRVFQTWIFSAPYQSASILFLILPSWLGGYKNRGEAIRSSEPVRLAWWKRVGWLILDPHSGVMLSFAGSIGVGIWRAIENYEQGTIDVHQTALTLLLTIAWPSLIWLDFVFAAFVPFVCLLCPSRLLSEPRESFLVRDHFNSVARPKHHFKSGAPLRVHRFNEILVGFAMIGWSAAAVVLSLLTDVFK